MSMVFASAILLIIGSAYAVLLKRKLAETLFLSIVTIVGVLYFFGLLNIRGCLLYGIYFVAAITLVCLIYIVYKWIKSGSVVKKAEIPQGLLLYGLVFGLFLFVNWGMVFHNWDEFSHWGIAVKCFYLTDAFVTLRDPGLYGVLFPHYVPGTSLFLYFFSRFESRFIEYYSYIAKNILYFSLFALFIKGVFTKAKSGKSVLLFFVFLLIPFLQGDYARGNFYSTLFVDQFLGVLFGFALLYYFVYQYEKSLFGILMVSASVFMLVMTKEIGLVLSLGVIGIILIDIVFYRRTRIKLFLVKNNTLLSKVGSFILLLSPLIAVLTVQITWSLLLSRSGIDAGERKVPAIHDIYLLFTGQVLPYQKETVKNLIAAVFFTRKLFPLPVSAFEFCLAFLAVAVFLAFYRRKQIAFKRTMTAAFVLTIGAGLYQVVLMILYVFTFSEYEAIQIASYERYTGTYLLGMIVFLMIFSFNEKDSRDTKQAAETALQKNNSDDSIIYIDLFMCRKLARRILIYLFCFVSCACLCFWTNAGIQRIVLGRTPFYAYQFTERETSAINKWKPFFKGMMPHIIAQGDTGILRLQLRYELIPYHEIKNIGRDWSFRPERPADSSVEDDMYYRTMTPMEWKEYISSNNIGLIYVLRSDDKFIEAYGHFFPNGVADGMLYYVNHENGQMLLIPAK